MGPNGFYLVTILGNLALPGKLNFLLLCRPTQLRIFKPSWKHLLYLTELLNKNWRQIRQGVHELWSFDKMKAHTIQFTNHLAFRALRAQSVAFSLLKLSDNNKKFSRCGRRFPSSIQEIRETEREKENGTRHRRESQSSCDL